MPRTAGYYYEKHQLDRFFSTDVLSAFQLLRYDKGDPICDIEGELNYLYFFVEGRCKVYVTLETGRQLLMCFYEPLQIFGDIEVFEQEAVANTTIEALTPCVCLGLERDFVKHQLAEDPKFLKQMCLSLSRKMERLLKNSAINALNTLENRVASYILATAAQDKEGRWLFTGNLTQIADLLGTSFRHLHRTLQKLCAEGILTKEKTTYVVVKKEALETLAVGIYIL